MRQKFRGIAMRRQQFEVDDPAEEITVEDAKLAAFRQAFSSINCRIWFVIA